MYVSTTFGIILTLIAFFVILFVAWQLTHNVQTGSDIPCTENNQCPAGFRCVGICLANGTCRSTNDCPLNELCVDGLCQQCANDQQCPIGSICQAGRCSVITCQGQADCPDDFFCDTQGKKKDSTGVTGIYVCRPNVCYADKDCREDQVCINGVCITPGAICTSNRDCRDGTLSCIGGICQECAVDTDCASGRCLMQPRRETGTTIGICADTHCGDSCSGECPSCMKYKKKHDGEYCYNGQGCLSGYCHQGRCQQEGAECHVGEETCPSERPFCVNGRCQSSPEGLICSYYPCPEGYHCIGSRCKQRHAYPGETCTQDQDCLSGYDCVDGRCLVKRS